MRTWLLLVTAVACEVTGDPALKAALDRPVLYAVVAVGYLSSFALLSALVFGEPLTAVMLLGLALIIAGVLVVEGGSQAAHNARAPLSGDPA